MLAIKYLVKIFALIGVLAFLYLIFNVVLVKSIKQVLVCPKTTDLELCEAVDAEFSYVSRDNAVLIKKLYINNSVIDFPENSCWVSASGSTCLDNFNENTTKFNKHIIPLATSYSIWRWKKVN